MHWRGYGRDMRRAGVAMVLAAAVSSCSLFGSGTPPTTTTTSVVITTTTTTSTTTTTTLPPVALLDDLPDIDRDSPASLIRAAQRLMSARGFRASVDGDFGRQTRARVRSLREALGLEPDVVIDIDVWRALYDEATLPFGAVDADVIEGVAALGGLRVPAIAFLFQDERSDDAESAHYLIPFFVDGPMFAGWARREATTGMDGTWTVCDAMTGSGVELVIITGFSNDDRAFTYRVMSMGRGRVDLRIAITSVVGGQCP
jgi:peptidoglycan hydrolase-like protein with peptidoglycan-binding domain